VGVIPDRAAAGNQYRSNNTTYVVSLFHLRQSGTLFLLVFVFTRGARKNENEWSESTTLPQAESVVTRVTA
jgi:hypothetical protein